MFWALCAVYTQSALPLLRQCAHALLVLLRYTIVPMLDGVTFGDFSARQPVWQCQTSSECAYRFCVRTATQAWIVCLICQFWQCVLAERRETPATAA